MREAHDIILRPVVTEKSSALLERNKYVFEVRPEATKTDIRQAVEKKFRVKVLKVNTINVPGKVRRLGRFSGRTPGYKKAVVSLAPGHSINVFE